MAHPVTWFQISGKNGERLQSFYRTVFGWRMRPTADRTLGMVAPEKPGGIAGGVGASRDGSASVAIYVNVNDLNEHLQKVEAAGGKRAMDPIDLGSNMGAIAGFLDPEGNWVGIWQPPKKARQARDTAGRTATAKRKPKKPSAKTKLKAAQRR